MTDMFPAKTPRKRSLSRSVSPSTIQDKRPRIDFNDCEQSNGESMPEAMSETMQDIENMTDKEKMNLLLRMVIDMRKNNVVTEEVIDRKLEQKCSEIKKDFECKFVRMKADIDNAVQAERDKENNVIIRNLPESRSENVMNKVHKLLREGLRLNLSVATAEKSMLSREEMGWLLSH